MTNSDSPTTIAPASSKGESVGTLDSLGPEIVRLASSVEFWRSIRFTAGVLAIIATVVTLAAQYMEVTQGRALMAAKDERLGLELKGKDVKIGEANRAAGDANKAAGEANKEAAKANEHAQRLEIEAAAQRERAAKAELALLEVQERIKERRVAGSDMERLVGFLADGPKTEIELAAPTGGSEPVQFARDLEQALAKAGWSASFIPMLVQAEPIAPGLTIEYADTPESASAALHLANSLKKLGFSSSLESRLGGGISHIQLLIGAKP